MALTADHVVVIGRGRLIAAASMEDFVARSSNSYVRVSSATAELRTYLDAAESVDLAPDGSLHVRGLDIVAVGAIAAAHGIALHELTEVASLEEAFIQLTHDSVEYTGTPNDHVATASR
jgi:ABC-2 type transport system ATP-binding protein